MKVLDEDAMQWSYITEGVVFAHRVSKHGSIKYSPFKILYNRDPIFPNDINPIQDGRGMGGKKTPPLPLFPV